MECYYTRVKSPVGDLLVAADASGLRCVSFLAGPQAAAPESGWSRYRGERDPAGRIVEKALKQLDLYFAGKLRVFTLPLAPLGTPFQKRVWKALSRIPYARTVSYGGVARGLGSPRASRAVGAAVGRNPLPIVIPCHRVLGAGGALTGFGGGLRIKEKLLEIEGRSIRPAGSRYREPAAPGQLRGKASEASRGHPGHPSRGCKCLELMGYCAPSWAVAACGAAS